jgi:hypothetical protein
MAMSSLTSISGFSDKKISTNIYRFWGENLLLILTFDPRWLPLLYEQKFQMAKQNQLKFLYEIKKSNWKPGEQLQAPEIFEPLVV